MYHKSATPRPGVEDPESAKLLDLHDDISADCRVRPASAALSKRRFCFLGRLVAATVIALLLAGLLALWKMHTKESCSNGKELTKRREWRALSPDERSNFITATHCLRELPSQLFPERPQVARWYDFGWTHYHIGNVNHRNASFLPWHRWLIVLLEDSLRTHCGYSGALPYWDWTLDWLHMGDAPVFDIQTGFGGNGNPKYVLESDDDALVGWCVTEGPFAGAQIPFDRFRLPGDISSYEPNNASFCLSRKFARGNTFNAPKLDPDQVSMVLEQPGYMDFLLDLESGPHNEIPKGIQGTFGTIWAPAEPLFWLHHMQLDRLWWIWQHMDPEHARAYEGHGSSGTLGDRLLFGNLSESVTVGEIIDTEADAACGMSEVQSRPLPSAILFPYPSYLVACDYVYYGQHPP
ncbi:hypothetical protein BST61_g6330 [Cercospora zeina]